jgi:hypothetical protein
MESLVSEIVGADAHECCDRSERPRCCFEITKSPRGWTPSLRLRHGLLVLAQADELRKLELANQHGLDNESGFQSAPCSISTTRIRSQVEVRLCFRAALGQMMCEAVDTQDSGV